MRTGVLVVLLFVSFAAHSQQKLRMGFVEFAPYYYTDKQGAFRGYLVDLARSISEKSGYSIEYRSYPVKRLVKYVVSGDVDIFLGMPTLKEFSENALISSMPIDNIQLRAYSLKPRAPITKKTDLNGKNILVLRGYSYGDWIQYIRDPENNVRYRIADTHKQALRMLVHRDIDYLLDYKLPIAHAQRGMDLPKLYHNDVVSFQPRIMVSRKLHNAKEVLKNLENSFQELYPGGAAQVTETFQTSLYE